MNKKPVYVKCPRCQLNYILKKDKYCEVCKKEMRAGGYEDDEEFFLDEIDEQILCTVCKLNYVVEGEIMCEACLEENLALMKDEEEEGWNKFAGTTAEPDEDELDLLPPVDETVDEELDSTFAKDLEEEFEDGEELEELDEDVQDDFDLDLDALDDLDLDDEDLEDEDEKESDDEDEEEF